MNNCSFDFSKPKWGIFWKYKQRAEKSNCLNLLMYGTILIHLEIDKEIDTVNMKAELGWNLMF